MVVARCWPVYGIAVYHRVDIGCDGMAQLFSKLTEQSRRSRQQCHAAQQIRWQPEVGKGRSSHSSAVEGQLATKYLRVDAANRLEQPQVRAAQTLAFGNSDDHRGSRISRLMYRVAQSWNEAPRGSLPCDGLAGKLIPFFIGLWKVPRDACQHACQKTPGIFRNAKEPRAASQQARRHRPLERIRGAI